MSDYDARDDDRLAALLADSVSDVEPSDALDTLRTRTKVTAMSTRRPWLFAVGGAVVATAAVITAIAVLANPDAPTSAPPADQTPSVSPTRATDPNTSDGPTPMDDPLVTEAAYFVGDTPSGPRLYREFQQTAASPLDLLETGPVDPDYRTLWPEGAFAGISDPEAGMVMVTLTDASYTERPAGMTDAEAAMAIEQVIYTLQAQFQERLAVQFRLGNNPVAEVYGQPTSEPLANGPVLETLALVSLTTPTEGEVASGDTVEVSGVANSFEANVVLRLQRSEGTAVVAEGYASAEGWMGEKLFPFEGTLDISGVPPGEYVLIAMTDDPSGGTEGGGSHTDSKRITVE